MNWLGDRVRLAGLFVLGALVPFGGLVLMAGVGAVALRAGGSTGAGGLLWLTGGVLFLYACLGLRLGLKSWPGPKGRRVTAEDAPELLARLEGCQAAWKGPRAVHVVVDPFAWGQDLLGTPTLGLLGWSRAHWLIGIYPLLALSTREWEALLSWEVVWWSEQQSWLNLQVKRLVAYWQMLYTELWEGTPTWRQRWGAGFMRPYARWMVRRMEGFLVRECIWNDALIAQQHGSATFARALCRLAILRALVDRRFFPELEARLKAGQPMPEDLYGFLAEVLGRCPESLEGMLELALDGLEPNAPPLLRLRLQKLGLEPVVPMPPALPAIRHLLDGTELLKAFQDELKGMIQGQLAQREQRRLEADRRFEALGTLMTGWYPNHPHAIEYLNLAFDRTHPEDFRILLEAARGAHPRHPDCRVLSVKWHLRQGLVPEAEAQVEAILAQNPFLAPICYRILGQHHRDHGALAAAEREWNRACRAEAMLERARKERRGASLADALEPHGCAGAQLEAMISYLKAVGGLGEAFLVRKKLTVHPEHPVLLLVVRAQGGWWDPKGRKRIAFQTRIARECPFPGRATAYVLVVRPGLLWRYRRLFEGLGALIL